MAIIIDRTKERDQSSESRRRFFERVRAPIKTALIGGSNTSSNGKMSAGKVNISSDNVREPFFCYELDPLPPQLEVIYNTAYDKGDTIKIRVENASGSGGGGAGDGEDEGNIDFILSDIEYTDLLFENCELPNYIVKNNSEEVTKKFRHAGYIKYGNPSNINIYRSYKESMARKFAIKGALEEELEELDQQTNKLLDYPPGKYNDSDLLFKLMDRKEEIHRKLTTIPYLEETDLRFKTKTPIIKKITKAVVFLMLDVSGSMIPDYKNRAKKFFYLVCLFLKTKYTKLDVVFISHTEKAKEVTEEEFFFGRETGGTSFSEAYKLVDHLISQKYSPDSHNIYIFHASDGEVFDDKEEQNRYIKNNISNKVQLGVYLNMIRESEVSGIIRTIFADTGFKTFILDSDNFIFQIFHHIFSKESKLTKDG